MICSDETEVVDKLCTLGEQFRDLYLQRKYAQAMYAYHTALTVAVFMEIDDELTLFLFGCGNTDETDENGLFHFEWVHKAQWECIKQGRSVPYVSAEEMFRIMKNVLVNNQ